MYGSILPRTNVMKRTKHLNVNHNINTCYKICYYLNIDCLFSSLVMWWPDKHFGYVDTCANSLLKVSCSNGSIRIKNVTSYSDTGRCNEMKNGCVKDRLEDLCDVKTLCSKDTNTDSCLFHKRFAIIDYVCKSE